MEELIEFVKSANWQTILALFVIGWYFTKDLREEIHEIRKELREQAVRTDHLYQICIDMLRKNQG